MNKASFVSSPSVYKRFFDDYVNAIFRMIGDSS